MRAQHCTHLNVFTQGERIGVQHDEDHKACFALYNCPDCNSTIGKEIKCRKRRRSRLLWEYNKPERTK